MKLLSFDIGIRNLSFCLFEIGTNKEDISILKWNNVSLTNDISYTCIHHDKKGCCGKEAKVMKDNLFLCTKHSKNYQYICQPNELTTSKLNKSKIDTLKQLSQKYNIETEPKWKKSDLINALNDFVNKNCYISITKSNASKTTGLTLARNIRQKLDTLLNDVINSIDLVIIENQLDNKMATVQGMITQYLVMKHLDINIEFISATNKLKDFLPEEKGKMTYSQRKKLGIQTCTKLVCDDERFSTWKDYMTLNGKKDDLSDCFLQGIWYIKYKQI